MSERLRDFVKADQERIEREIGSLRRIIIQHMEKDEWYAAQTQFDNAMALIAQDQYAAKIRRAMDREIAATEAAGEDGR